MNAVKPPIAFQSRWFPGRKKLRAKTTKVAELTMTGAQSH